MEVRAKMSNSKIPFSYFTFVVLIFLGLFIYLGLMLSSDLTDKVESIDTSENMVVMTSGLTGKKLSESLANIPQKEENIEMNYISDVKPIIDEMKKEPPVSLQVSAQNRRRENSTVKKSVLIKKIKAKTMAKAKEQHFATNSSNIYIVKHNDTLTGIARQTLGTTRRWREIARLNSDIISNPHKLKVGTRLRLPADNLDNFDISKKEAFQTYKVRKADSLYSLAVRFYGTPKAVEVIKEANKDKLSNSNILREGMMLSMPQKSFYFTEDRHISKVGFFKYKIKKDDTLSDISYQFYNKSTEYQKILKANPNIKDAKNLKVGSIINIPIKK